MNCWQMAEYESDVMWRLYDEKPAPVAIKSTTGRLKEALGDYEVTMRFEKPSVFLGEIQYRRPSQDPIPESNLLNLPLSKWVQFKHEEEVRAVVGSIPPTSHYEDEGGEFPVGYLDWNHQPTGIKVNVDLSTLIKEIRVSPGASESEYEDIRSICETYGLCDEKVSHSSIRRSWQDD